MPSNFPTSPDDIQNDVANSTPELDVHPGLHNQLADAVMAIEAELLAGGTMNLAAHVAAADPHSVYLTQTEGDARYTTIAGGIPDGSITSAKIADGAVGTADLANASVTNVKLASDTARANLLTNGGFEIWQRGNGPFTANGAYTADRWLIVLGGTSTLSVSRDTTNVDGSLAAAACTYVHNATSWWIHIVENLAQLKGKTVTFSMRVRTSTASAIRLTVWDGVASTLSSSHTGSGTYETLTVTTTINAGANTVSPRVEFIASCTAYLDNAMLVVGSVAADYAPLHPADDLARCLRYYEVVGVPGAGDVWIRTWCGSGGQSITLSFAHKVQKSVTPTVTKVGTWPSSNASQPAITAPSMWGFGAYITGTAANDMYVNNGSAGNCITIEANP